MLDGVELEPLAAPLDGAVEVLPDVLPEVDPDPAAPLCGDVLLSVEDDDELELDGELGGVTVPDAEPDALPDGVLGVVAPLEVEPEDEVAPDPGLVRVVARSPSLSQPASNPAPSARDTATANVESLM